MENRIKSEPSIASWLRLKWEITFEYQCFKCGTIAPDNRKNTINTRKSEIFFMKTQNRLTLLHAFAVIFLMMGCERDYNNPWDGKANLAPEAWAPQNLAIEDVSITEKKLTWTYAGGDNFEGFKLDRKAGNAAWQEAYQVLPKETRNWTDTEIVPDPSLTYAYRVFAFAGKYASSEVAISAIAEFAAPTNLQTEKLTDKSYKLTWQDNSTGEQGFKIDRKIDEGNWIIAFGNLPENQTSFTDTNVFRAINVEYRVYAFFESLETSKVNVPTTAELTAPTDLQLEKLNDKSYRLSWTDNSIGERGFKIDRRIDQGNWIDVFGRVSANQGSFVDTNVFRAVSVEYRVYAFVEDYESIKAITGTTAELIAPSNLQITPNSITSINLNWQDNSTGEDGFIIEGKVEGGNWEPLTTLPANITTFEDHSFELNKTVYYRVNGFVGQHNSSYAEESFNSIIPSPSNLLITPNSLTSVTLSWQDNSIGEAGFLIDRKVNSGAWELTYGSVGHNQISFNDNDVNWQANDYAYRVHAFLSQYNSVTIESTISWPEVITTPPSNIGATSVTSGGSIAIQGNYPITARGVCYSTTQNPDLSDPHTSNGFGASSFTCNLVGLLPITTYFVRAYSTNSFGTAYGNEVGFTTLFFCGSTFSINHVAGIVAPVTKTVIYGSVTNIPGATTKCWITRNLGASQQATAVNDATETSAGWYWQFNQKQGYKHDGTTRTPNTAWVSNISETSDWITANDPCTLELGIGWRIPTKTEWTNVDASGNWINWSGPWNSGLKLHAAGYLRSSDGSLYSCGSSGYYWSSIQYNATSGWTQFFFSGGSNLGNSNKANGFSVRCLRD